MNEATFEANLNNELKRIFPSFLIPKISHQKTFRLKFGHHKIVVDGSCKDGYIGGRLDVLLEMDKKPMAVLELKKPGIKLTIEDRDQGISYARLLDNMPPLVIVSNGSETIFYKTYDKTEWHPNKLDDLAIESLFSNALAAASNEIDDAVRLLMGNRSDFWEGVLREYTNEALTELKGDIEDFSYPISENFSIKRDVVSQITQSINDGEKFIALVGNPISGKTNAIYQFCLSNGLSNIVPLYIDASSISYGVLQHISNQFSTKLFVNTDAGDVRKWIVGGLRNNNDNNNGPKLVIIIDGWSTKAKDNILNDVQELIELSKNNNISIIISVDESTFNEISYIDGRQTKSKIGRLFNKIEIERINDSEFKKFQYYMFNSFNAIFYEGAKYNLQYRNPGVLRILVSRTFKKSRHISLVKNNKVLVIPSVSSINILEAVWQKYMNIAQLRNDMQDLIKAYISDVNIQSNAELLLVSYGKCYISYDSVQDILSDSKIERLRNQGYIELINGPNGTGLVLFKVPELFSASASYFILKEMERMILKNDFDGAYGYLIRRCQSLPYSDLVGAKVIFELSKSHTTILKEMVERLLNDTPLVETRHEEGDFLAHTSILKASVINFDKNEEYTVISNIYPWLILSQLACYPIGSGDGNRSIHFRILCRVGSFKELLRMPENNAVEDMEGFHYHYRKNIGHFLCGKVGIVEPIIYSMQTSFINMPQQMIELCKLALNDDRFFLAWRLNKAATSMITYDDTNVVSIVKEAIDILEPLVKTDFTSEQLIKRNGISRNDLCPCRSRKKFKECCGKS
ncbi:type I restriction enzyme HsdR N-terminal domain-containing protein [Clostridium estertheticum]|uniref:SEC-C metal-binding domain-containing protein n=1 Tax=Clostridium estertheticum TaxID=238834 RepID=UPI001C0E8C10|nr:SEC-C metal-binding domain-containing protein [Clostridium estertheticum]MBU3214783.1 type I restriction enzyme HsdR N-terminal domain-containing protein [Clostridium estertheticum]WAG57195.1 type I restriction enzyme HsdR N-terminal domain-containing protein [Clostridium estertheticum]